MKKNILRCMIAFIFALSCTGCIIIDVDSLDRHTMTFCNASSYDVTDWYVKNSDGTNYVKRVDEYYPVDSHSSNSIFNIPEGYYRVFFAFKTNPGMYDYWKSSREVYLNKDKTYYLYNYSSYYVSDNFSRKISNDNPITSALFDENSQTICLQDESGNVIEFERVD